MVELLKPLRGGFMRPFGCGIFIRDFLIGRGAAYGRPTIDPEVGAPQADVFRHYKLALMRATALDRATKAEEIAEITVTAMERVHSKKSRIVKDNGSQFIAKEWRELCVN